AVRRLVSPTPSGPSARIATIPKSVECAPGPHRREVFSVWVPLSTQCGPIGSPAASQQRARSGHLGGCRKQTFRAALTSPLTLGNDGTRRTFGTVANDRLP